MQLIDCKHYWTFRSRLMQQFRKLLTNIFFEVLLLKRDLCQWVGEPIRWCNINSSLSKNEISRVQIPILTIFLRILYVCVYICIYSSHDAFKDAISYILFSKLSNGWTILLLDGFYFCIKGKKFCFRNIMFRIFVYNIFILKIYYIYVYNIDNSLYAWIRYFLCNLFIIYLCILYSFNKK